MSNVCFAEVRSGLTGLMLMGEDSDRHFKISTESLFTFAIMKLLIVEDQQELVDNIRAYLSRGDVVCEMRLTWSFRKKA